MPKCSKQGCNYTSPDLKNFVMCKCKKLFCHQCFENHKDACDGKDEKNLVEKLIK